MAHNTSISLGDHFSDFIASQVGTGRYNSASDVIRAGLRMLEEHETKVRALQDALIAGEQSGAASAFDFDSFIAKKQSELKVK